jgi:hypothetical protein
MMGGDAHHGLHMMGSINPSIPNDDAQWASYPLDVQNTYVLLFSVRIMVLLPT